MLGLILPCMVDDALTHIQGKIGMKQSVLGQRRAVAIQSIAERILNLTGDDIDLVSGLKGNSEHRQLFMLERIAEKLKTVKMPDPVELQPILLESGFDLNSLLELEGMSKTSQKVLAAYFGQLESEQEPNEESSEESEQEPNEESSEESEQEPNEDGSSN